MRTPLVARHPMVARVIVTPIIDVALTLVVILLMTAPMLSVPDIAVDVPQARSRGVESESRVTVTVGRAGELAVDSERVRPDTFQRALASRLVGIEDQTLVVVRADRGVTYAQVSGVLQQVRDAGARRMAVAARPKGESER